MKPTKKMEPELGQMIFGCPTGSFELDDHADALLMAILREVGRVYWNKNQAEWHYAHTGIPGLETRPYYWGDDDKEAAKPNLKYKNVEVRWYKYPGRSMSVNKNMTVDQWAAWFYAVLAAVRKFEKKQGGNI